MRVIDFLQEVASISGRLSTRSQGAYRPDEIAAMTLATFSRPDLMTYLLQSLGAEALAPIDQLIGATLRMAQVVHFEATSQAIDLTLPGGRFPLAAAPLPPPPWFAELDGEAERASAPDPVDAWTPDSRERRGERRMALNLGRVDFVARYCPDADALAATTALVFEDPRCEEAAGMLVAPMAGLQAWAHAWREHPRRVFSGLLFAADEASLGCVYASPGRPPDVLAA